MKSCQAFGCSLIAASCPRSCVLPALEAFPAAAALVESAGPRLEAAGVAGAARLRDAKKVRFAAAPKDARLPADCSRDGLSRDDCSAWAAAPAGHSAALMTDVEPAKAAPAGDSARPSVSADRSELADSFLADWVADGCFPADYSAPVDSVPDEHSAAPRADDPVEPVVVRDDWVPR